MIGLYDIPAYLTGLPLVAALAGLGLVVGVLTGLFGVGGAFVITPLLNVLLGVPYTLATGCSMSFTIGTGAAGWARHMRLGNVALKTTVILVGASVCGTILGADLHVGLKGLAGPARFPLVMHGLFFAVLMAVAWLVARGPEGRKAGASLLQRLPVGPRIFIRAAALRDISLPGLCAVGLAIGLFKGLLGIGGGVLLMPVMVLVVGLSVHQAVGTSLGVVMFSSVAGALLYGGKGQVSLWIVMPLLTGSVVGAQLGAWLCQRLHAARIRRYFAVLACLVALVVAADFVLKVRAVAARTQPSPAAAPEAGQAHS